MGLFLENCTGQRPAAYAQEPQYNTQDGVFLSTLGIQTIQDPDGFSLLTDHSFAFCPGAEYHVELQALLADPFLYLGGELLLRLDTPLGGAHHYHHNSQDPEWGGEPNTTTIMPREEATEDLMMDEATSSSAAKVNRAPRGDTSQLPDDQTVIRRFLQNRQSAKIPDLDLQDHPLHHTWLYWPITNQG